MLRTFVFVAVTTALVASALAGEMFDEAKLIAIISSDAPPQTKAIPCKQLAVCGTKAAVPALAALLPNAELSSWARIALEAIPDPAADEALRAAVGKLQGRILVGVINSLGVRRDAKAVEILAAKLKDADPEVASASAEALGRIGGPDAAKALEPLLASAPPAVRPYVAYGCILCAERLLKEGKGEEAAKLYDTVRKADVPKNRLAEAARGSIMARGAAGVPLLLEQLRSPDKTLFWLGLRVARELPGPEATEALVAEMGKAAPDRQPLLFLALADRNDPRAMPAMLAAAKSGPKALRIVAIGALERVGNATCLPVLLEAAADDDAQVAKAALTALVRVPGQDVDADVAARLLEAKGKMRQSLIEVAGMRRIAAAVPAILQSVGDTDPAVRAAAVEALGAIGGEKELPGLVAAVQKARDTTEQGAIEKALVAVCARVGATSLAQLAPLAKSGESAQRIIAVHALAVAGGPEALAAVKAALGDKEDAVQDEAARALSTWPNKWPDDATVVEPLLALAKGGKKPAHKVLALRGYFQYIQGAKTLADAERLAKVTEVMPLVKGPEEKRLAISVLGNIPSVGALETLTTFADDPAVAEEACAAIVSLAGKPELKGVSKDQLRKALEAAAEKSKAARTKKRAEDLLKTTK